MSNTNKNRISDSTFYLVVMLVIVLPIVGYYTYRQVFGETTINKTITTNTDLESGLVGHWTFDGPDMNWGASSAEVLDTSGNGNNGDANFTSTSSVPGKLGQAISLNNTSDYVNAGDINALDTTTDLSVCAWVYHNSVGDDDPIVAKLSSITGGGFMLYRNDIDVRNDTYSLYVPDASDADQVQIVGAANASVINKWTYVCATFEAGSSTGLHLYIDGLEDANSPISTAVIGSINAGSGPLTIGSDSNGGDGGAGGKFDGKIDDVRIYNRVLSASEVERLYDLGATTHINTAIATNNDLENGLLLHWTFDGSLAGAITDSSGNGYNGHFGPSTPTTTALAPGRIGQGIHFDGSNDFASTTLSGTVKTISFWVKPGSTTESIIDFPAGG